MMLQSSILVEPATLCVVEIPRRMSSRGGAKGALCLLLATWATLVLLA